MDSLVAPSWTKLAFRSAFSSLPVSLSFISRMTEHDVLVTDAIKSHIAFLQLLTDCLFSSNHWLFVVAMCTLCVK